MKKLILAYTLLLPYSACGDTIQNQFKYDEIPSGSVSVANYRVFDDGSHALISARSTSCKISSDDGMISCFAGFNNHHSTNTIVGYVVATDEAIVVDCPIWYHSSSQVRLKYNDTELAVDVDGPRTVPLPPYDGPLAALYVTGATFSGFALGWGTTLSDCYLNVVNHTDSHPTRRIGRVLVETDVSYGDLHYGITPTPTSLTLQGYPEWTGAVTLSGVLAPGRIVIKSDRTISVDLGAGTSAPGREFETKMTPASGPFRFTGRMTISGVAETTGVNLYNVQIIHTTD